MIFTQQTEEGGLLDRILIIVAILAVAGLAGILLWGKPLSVRLSGIPTQAGSTNEGLQVQGTGTVQVIPEKGTITLGVTTEGDTEQIAQQENAKKINAVREVLRRNGIEEKDVQTATFSISPQYDYTSTRNEITGYQATQSMTVTIREIDAAGTILTEATAAGANTIQGLQFMLDTTRNEELKQQARILAIEDAREKAEELAKAADVRLGRVMAISEGVEAVPRYGVGEFALSSADQIEEGIAPEIEAGEQDITATVTITFELE